jgi:hypothetical protein
MGNWRTDGLGLLPAARHMTERNFHDRLSSDNRAAADAIMSGGFRDGVGFYGTPRRWSGVWVSDRPLDCNEGTRGDALLRIKLSTRPYELDQFEWVEEGKTYREWLVPAVFLRVRADDDSPTGKGRSQARRRSRREARPTEDRQRDRTQGAKAACEGLGYLEGCQVARHRNWHGAAHLKGASNEPARGAAMTGRTHAR